MLLASSTLVASSADLKSEIRGQTGEDGGQNSETALQQSSLPEYQVTRWTSENGLPQNTIKALAQTRDGYLWFGTLKGLARFDGWKFKIFDRDNTPEMMHDSINELAPDQQDGSL